MRDTHPPRPACCTRRGVRDLRDVILAVGHILEGDPGEPDAYAAAARDLLRAATAALPAQHRPPPVSD